MNSEAAPQEREVQAFNNERLSSTLENNKVRKLTADDLADLVRTGSQLNAILLK